jgi:hypothetical protein
MFSTIVLALLLPVQPQVSFGMGVDVQVAVPTVRFEVEPPLVVVSPGVTVVQDCDTDVFFVDGFYWTASHGTWYRTRNYRGGWVAMPGRRVPVRIARVHPGTYRHFRGGRPYYRGPGHSGGRGRAVYRGRGGYDRRVIVRDHRGGGRGRNSGHSVRHRGGR